MKDKDNHRQKELRTNALLSLFGSSYSWDKLVGYQRDMIEAAFDMGFEVGAKAGIDSCADLTSHPA